MQRVTQRQRLEGIKRQLEEGLAFIDQDKVEIMMPFSSHGKVAINKQIGSDLCQLRNALDGINSLLAGNKVMRFR